MAKVALLVPVVIGICKVLKVKAKSATASALMLGSVFRFIGPLKWAVLMDSIY